MQRPVVLAILDGVGISEKIEGNAVKDAYTPNLDNLLENYPNTLIHAHGTYVGLPSDDDMGNSEVGHNALGSGQIYSQGARLVNEAIKSKELFNSDTWKKLVNFCKEKGKMHFIGLLSDGNVHSHINHLFALLEQSKREGVKEVRVHILLDGRDVMKTSALHYVKLLEDKINSLNDENYHAMIASGGGRMKITMDRYEANWPMVEKGWHTHVLGDIRGFTSVEEAILTYRKENPDIIDQDLDAFVIVDDNNYPVGEILDNDSVVLFNFRGDRAIEISKAFDEENFDKFDRVRVPNVMYAGLLQYDADANIPKLFLTEPPKITNTLTEELLKYNLRQYAISETQKYGHVTYFWNGNKASKFNEFSETYELIPSDNISFDERPEMKSYEITDRLIEAINSKQYNFLRINFPNGDMVGHTGNYDATVKAIEAVDVNLGRIMECINKNNAILIVLSDHGNAEEMLDKNNVIKTSHTTNPVPFIIYGKNIDNIKIKDGTYGLANVASSITTLLDINKNPLWEESIITKL